MRESVLILQRGSSPPTVEYRCCRPSGGSTNGALQPPVPDRSRCDRGRDAAAGTFAYQPARSRSDRGTHRRRSSAWEAARSRNASISIATTRSANSHRSFNDLASRLQESEIRRKALIADIAHELRTPLTNIRGSIESLQDGLVTASPDELRALHDDALLLQRLVADLHELSIADAGGLSLHLVSIDIGDELEAAACDSRVAIDIESGSPARRVRSYAISSSGE